jgi:hypothetical protein
MCVIRDLPVREVYLRGAGAYQILGGAGMAVPRKAISQKKSTGHCSGLIFEGFTSKVLAE